MARLTALTLIASTRDPSRILFWCGILLAAAIALALTALAIRKKLNQPDVPTIATGFTLADFRDMHERGDLTQEEFERARARIIASQRISHDDPQDSQTTAERTP